MRACGCGHLVSPQSLEPYEWRNFVYYKICILRACFVHYNDDYLGRCNGITIPMHLFRRNTESVIHSY